MNGKLVLTRKPHERIVIGDDIVIEVVAIRGKFVRLAITAPTEVSIHRQEVFDCIRGIEPQPVPEVPR